MNEKYLLSVISQKKKYLLSQLENSNSMISTQLVVATWY